MQIYIQQHYQSSSSALSTRHACDKVPKFVMCPLCPLLPLLLPPSWLQSLTGVHSVTQIKNFAIVRKDSVVFEVQGNQIDEVISSTIALRDYKCWNVLQFSEFKQLLDIFLVSVFEELEQIYMKFWRHFESVLLILQISNDGFRNNRTILNDFNDVIFNSLAHNRHWMLIMRCGVDLTS